MPLGAGPGSTIQFEIKDEEQLTTGLNPDKEDLGIYFLKNDFLIKNLVKSSILFPWKYKCRNLSIINAT